MTRLPGLLVLAALLLVVGWLAIRAAERRGAEQALVEARAAHERELQRTMDSVHRVRAVTDSARADSIRLYAAVSRRLAADLTRARTAAAGATGRYAELRDSLDAAGLPDPVRQVLQAADTAVAAAQAEAQACSAVLLTCQERSGLLERALAARDSTIGELRPALDRTRVLWEAAERRGRPSRWGCTAGIGGTVGLGTASAGLGAVCGYRFLP